MGRNTRSRIAPYVAAGLFSLASVSTAALKIHIEGDSQPDASFQQLLQSACPTASVSKASWSGQRSDQLLSNDRKDFRARLRTQCDMTKGAHICWIHIGSNDASNNLLHLLNESLTRYETDKLLAGHAPSTAEHLDQGLEHLATP